MTRISSSIRPMELCDQMLLAEHREIIRIPNTIKSGKAKVHIDKIPQHFKLGTGHVTFFYNKLKYLHERYLSLHRECLERDFNVQNYDSCFKDLPTELYNDWEECSNSRVILVERINERLATMKNIKYLHENIDLEHIQL